LRLLLTVGFHENLRGPFKRHHWPPEPSFTSFTAFVEIV
jgi:hypothetical protein